MASVKVSVTVDEELLAEARSIAPGGNLSAFVNDALGAQVRRQRLRELVADEEPASEEVMRHVRAQWPFS